MIALYIIGGIVAYLLIGAVVVGILLKRDPSLIYYDIYTPLILWPLVVVALAFYAPVVLCVRLAKRIGGVKD